MGKRTVRCTSSFFQLKKYRHCYNIWARSFLQAWYIYIHSPIWRLPFCLVLYSFFNILVFNRHLGTESEILTIDIKPGWKKGTKITFPDKGNEQPNQLPADLVFVIDEKPHELYTREGNDLLAHRKIDLVDALAGTTVSLKTLDGRELVVKLTDVVTPGYELVIAKEGMPMVKENGRRGNLRIKLGIDFPKRLSSEQRRDIRKVLGGQSQQQRWARFERTTPVL
jgi:DnaJ homolog subfamily B member 4